MVYTIMFTPHPIHYLGRGCLLSFSTDKAGTCSRSTCRGPQGVMIDQATASSLSHCPSFTISATTRATGPVCTWKKRWMFELPEGQLYSLSPSHQGHILCPSPTKHSISDQTAASSLPPNKPAIMSYHHNSLRPHLQLEEEQPPKLQVPPVLIGERVTLGITGPNLTDLNTYPVTLKLIEE